MNITLKSGKIIVIDDAIVTKVAHERWELRKTMSIPGTAEDDWNFAIDSLRLEYEQFVDEGILPDRLVAGVDETQTAVLEVAASQMTPEARSMVITETLRHVAQADDNIRKLEQEVWEAAKKQPTPLPPAQPFVFVPQEGETKHQSSRRRVNESIRHRRERQRVVSRFFQERQTSFLPGKSDCLMGLAQHAGCGPATICYLTSEHPLLVKERYPHLGVTSEQMVEHLRSKGFEVTPLNDDVLKVSNNVMETPVGPQHVVLLSMRATADKNTWNVMWGGKLVHNWSKEKLRTETFINHDVLGKWLLWHPSWTSDTQASDLLRRATPTSGPVDIETIRNDRLEQEYADEERVRRVFGSDPTVELGELASPT